MVALTSAYTPDRSLVQTTPGPAPEGDLSAGILALLRARKAATALSPAPAQYAGESFAAAPAARRSAPMSSYVPQMGSAPKKAAPITRVVTDPNASPYTKMATGFDPGAKLERYIPGVGWEFEDLRPHGNSGGFVGGGADSSLHSSDSLGGPGPANANIANRDNFDTRTGMLRQRPDMEPLTGAQRVLGNNGKGLS